MFAVPAGAVEIHVPSPLGSWGQAALPELQLPCERWG